MNWQDVLATTWDPATATDEMIWQSIRAWRKRELTACDWTQLPDVDLPNKWDWAVYRQALRDLPAQNPDPKLIVFPVQP